MSELQKVSAETMGAMEFGKATTDTEITDTTAKIPEPVKLAEEEDQGLIGILTQAKDAEKAGNFIDAIKFYDQYRAQYENLRQVEDEQKDMERAKAMAEFLGIDEEKGLNYIQKLIDEGASKRYVVSGLAGLDSKQAWDMRQNLLDGGAPEDSLVVGLAGLDSKKAWDMRQDNLSSENERIPLALSLTGLDSQLAWDTRGDLLQAGANSDFVALSLAGVDSEVAWVMRRSLWKKEKAKLHLSDSFSGKRSLVESLAGLDSKEAWDMRRDLLLEEDSEKNVCKSLAGVDSEEAWTMRDDFLARGVVDIDSLAQSLSGLDSQRAWDMRLKLLASATDNEKGYVAQGVFGEYVMVGVRAARAREKAEKEKNV